MPLIFVQETWKPYVVPNGHPFRRAYELCTLSALGGRLPSRDIYLPHTCRYADPETFLIPRSTCPALREDVCRQLDLDPIGTKRLSNRAQESRWSLRLGDLALCA